MCGEFLFQQSVTQVPGPDRTLTGENVCQAQWMTMYPTLHLKAGHNRSVLARHPWIFSGALERVPEDVPHGALVHVIDTDAAIAATGTLSRKSMIAVRVFAFEEAAIDSGWLHQQIREADERRRLLGFGQGTETTGYRVVFGESDHLPGLVVDRYADVLVVQISTAGMELLRDQVVECLVDVFHPSGIYERSDHSARNDEGLRPVTGLLSGQVAERIEFLECGRKCLADIVSGQKTGFYLDQRDLRMQVFKLAHGRKTLDLFSYSGATGVAAMRGGATGVHFVDSSETALHLCAEYAQLNGIDSARVTHDCVDVFQWLGHRSTPEYDLVLLDPPALIKNRRHTTEGRKAYHFLNRAALRLITDGGILVTSSCSAYFTEDDLFVTLRRAAEQADVDLHVLGMLRQSPDHPISLTFPESFYLKSVICQIRR